jgi:hypothetical protein
MIQQAPDSLEAIRERIRRMTDAQLIDYGRAARQMANPANNHGTPNPSFAVQLEEARQEWRRRHPKAELGNTGVARPNA